MEQSKKSKRGFASMSPERRREFALKGGKSLPPRKRSFAQNSDAAARAGQKGGRASYHGKWDGTGVAAA